MALRNIVEDGDDILRKKAREIVEIDQRIKDLAKDMEETMLANRGVGIAAPQVGILKRMFLACPNPELEEMPRVFINPEILSSSGNQSGDEGCLSVPGYVGTVERPTQILLRYTDLEGETREETFEEYAAVIICHEFDHLEGILYTDRAENVRPVASEEEENLA